MAITPRYDVTAMQQEMFARGWLVSDLAQRAGISHMTIRRFFDGVHQTPRAAKHIADAFGHSVRRYLLPAKGRAA